MMYVCLCVHHFSLMPGCASPKLSLKSVWFTYCSICMHVMSILPVQVPTGNFQENWLPYRQDILQGHLCLIYSRVVVT
jgi:hypothetical protein